MPSIYDIPAELGQNYIDYIMKQYQVWIDGLFGSDNDNSSKIASDPLVFSGRVAYKVYGGWVDSSIGGYWVCTQNVNITSNNDGNVLSGQSSFDRGGNYATADASVSAWVNSQRFHCDMWGAYERSPLINNHWYFRSVDYDTAEINANVYLKNTDGTNLFYGEYPSITYNGYFTKVNNQGTGISSGDAPVIGVNSSAPYDCTLGTPIVNIPSYCNTEYIWNVDRNASDYHSSTYVTNEGDTITVQYSPYSVNTGTYGLDVSYDDLYNIFAGIILPNIPQGNTLVVPTYDEIKYSDMGDFYITPLHQYGELPTAPTFENEIDLAEYPQTIGSVASKFVDFLPASISALLAGAVIVSAIVSFIRRDT